MRPRPPYYMTTPERAVGDVKAMLVSTEENEEGQPKLLRFSQIQRVIRTDELQLLNLASDSGFLRDRRETDMARFARATRAYFDPTSLIDHRSNPYDYRQVDGYWEMVRKIRQSPNLNTLSVGELFRFVIRHRDGRLPVAVRRVLFFDKNHQSQFSK